MKLTLRIAAFCALSFLIIQSCNKNGIRAVGSITSLNVTSGPSNTTVVITGAGFSTETTSEAVYFNGKAATIVGATGTQLTVLVPTGAGTGPVTVSVNGGALITGPVFTYVPTPTVSTVAGNGVFGNQNGPVASATFIQLSGIAVDSKGNIFVSENNGTGIIREISNGVVSTFAGDVNQTGVSNNGTGTGATFMYPSGMAIDAQDNLYVAEVGIRKLTPAAVTTTAVNLTMIPSTKNVAVDAAGNIYTTDAGTEAIYKTTPAGVTSVFAGGSVGTGAAAPFNNPTAITVDNAGNLYVIDANNILIRKVTAAGVVSTLAGSGQKGSQDGKGTAASFFGPSGLAVDASGNVFVSDQLNNNIRRITPDGTVSTIGNGPVMGQGGPPSSIDGNASIARFDTPVSLAFDRSGNLYVTEYNAIRKITFQ